MLGTAISAIWCMPSLYKVLVDKYSDTWYRYSHTEYLLTNTVKATHRELLSNVIC